MEVKKSGALMSTPSSRVIRILLSHKLELLEQIFCILDAFILFFFASWFCIFFCVLVALVCILRLSLSLEQAHDLRSSRAPA